MEKKAGLKEFRVWIELILLGLHILAVVLIFRAIEDRKTAGLVAGSLFLEIGLVITFLEFKYGRALRSLAFWSALIFFLGSAIPVMALRLAFWETPFDQIEWMGVTGGQLHRLSNFTYMAIIFMVVVEGLRDRLANRFSRVRR